MCIRDSRQLRFLIIACCCFYLASLGTATYSTVMAKSALMTEEEITLALFLYPVGNALFTLISGFVSDKFGRKVTIVAMSCSALTCYLLFIFSGMFKWTPYLTGLLSADLWAVTGAQAIPSAELCFPNRLLQTCVRRLR